MKRLAFVLLVGLVACYVGAEEGDHNVGSPDEYADVAHHAGHAHDAVDCRAAEHALFSGAATTATNAKDAESAASAELSSMAKHASGAYEAYTANHAKFAYLALHADEAEQWVNADVTWMPDEDDDSYCPKEMGACETRDGSAHMKSFQFALTDGKTEHDCFRECADVDVATACSIEKGDDGTDGCYVHKGDVAKGDGGDGSCWVFDKCVEYEGPRFEDISEQPVHIGAPDSCKKRCGMGPDESGRECKVEMGATYGDVAAKAFKCKYAIYASKAETAVNAEYASRAMRAMMADRAHHSQNAEKAREAEKADKAKMAMFARYAKYAVVRTGPVPTDGPAPTAPTGGPRGPRPTMPTTTVPGNTTDEIDEINEVIGGGNNGTWKDEIMEINELMDDPELMDSLEKRERAKGGWRERVKAKMEKWSKGTEAQKMLAEKIRKFKAVIKALRPEIKEQLGKVKLQLKGWSKEAREARKGFYKLMKLCVTDEMTKDEKVNCIKQAAEKIKEQSTEDINVEDDELEMSELMNDPPKKANGAGRKKKMEERKKRCQDGSAEGEEKVRCDLMSKVAAALKKLGLKGWQEKRVFFKEIRSCIKDEDVEDKETCIGKGEKKIELLKNKENNLQDEEDELEMDALMNDPAKAKKAAKKAAPKPAKKAAAKAAKKVGKKKGGNKKGGKKGGKKPDANDELEMDALMNDPARKKAAAKKSGKKVAHKKVAKKAAPKKGGKKKAARKNNKPDTNDEWFNWV